VFLALDLIFLSENRACGFVALGLSGVYTLFLIIARPSIFEQHPPNNKHGFHDRIFSHLISLQNELLLPGR